MACSLLSLRELEDRASPDTVLLARALFEIADALRRLGTGNAATEMGALEYVAKEIKEGAELIAAACATS